MKLQKKKYSCLLYTSKDADLVVTGEGRLDRQTAMGKAPIGVAKLAKKYGKTVIAFAAVSYTHLEAIEMSPNTLAKLGRNDKLYGWIR